MERPSGVSSRSDDSRASSRASASATPGAGTICEASRLPNVMVPVLSSRITSTSPAASTARPLIARTLKRATRSMPAMPIADSRPPMVVGMRHTSSATRATTLTDAPAYVGERLERDGRQQEHERQAREQDRQGQLVGRLLALRALDQRDHPVEEGLARVGRDADDERVRDDGGAAGHARADVRARLLEDGCGLAGDRGLVDVGHALDHVAVGRDGLALADDDDVAGAELGAADLGERPRPHRGGGRSSPIASAAGLPPGPGRVPRRRPRRRWRTGR